MNKSTKYECAANDANALGAVVPMQLAEYTANALAKLSKVLGDDVCGYVANRLHMNKAELYKALAAEQIDGVALAMYNIEKRGQSVIIGDQTGIGKGRQAAAMIRYGLLAGYLPVFFTDRYTLFSDMYRDCKALGIKDARPLVVNSGVSVVDFDHVVEEKEIDSPDEIWSPVDEDDEDKHESERMALYQEHYEVVYKSPKKTVLQEIFHKGDVPMDVFDYLMITYSQLKDAKRDMTRLNFLRLLCEKHRVLFVFDEAHKSSSVSAGKISVITQGINMILEETPQTQCVFLSATFAKRPESLVTFMRRTVLSALATENTLKIALHNGGMPMQEYVSSCLAEEGQMIRREHSDNGLPSPIYTYLDDDIAVHGEQFDKVMFFFREIVKLSTMVASLVCHAQSEGLLLLFNCYPTRAQLFYINKVLLLSLKAKKVAERAIENVHQGKSVIIGMSDTLECVIRDTTKQKEGSVRGDISSLLLRLLDKTVCGTGEFSKESITIFDAIKENEEVSTSLNDEAEGVYDYYKSIKHDIVEEVFHLPMSPIDVIRQLITAEKFVTPNGEYINIRFEECTGRAHQLEYLSPEGDDDFINATIKQRKKRHSNLIFNDFQNNKLDVILINACGAIGASAHAVATAEVPEDQVRQRKMLIVQNDLDVNIDLQKRGRINRTGQRLDLPPLYEYIITAIPSEKRLNMMLRAKLRSLSANTAAWQDQDREQADFIDIDNKYGNEVATEYLAEHLELALVLDLKGKVTASKLLARLAMLSVNAQQNIIDELLTAYTTLESELRRINQWDLEREFRDFEAVFVREELFTTAKSKTRLGGCSYLTTYKCKQKTYPYSYKSLKKCCNGAKMKYGNPYKENTTLQKQVKNYYALRNKNINMRFETRYNLLYSGAKRILTGYCGDENLAEAWLQRANSPTEKWNHSEFKGVENMKLSKQIMHKLISFSNEYNHLLELKKKEMKKYAEERKRLIKVLTKAEIGKGYYNVSGMMASEDCPQRVIAVLKEIHFGKENQNRFLPSQVEFVFALTAIAREIRINLVHNSRWSNYQRLWEIINSTTWTPSASVWDKEIALNNNKIVERKIITGNILGAYVHPAIAELKPRFISFSIKSKTGIKSGTQIGLLLPMDENKIRKTINSVSIPLHKGLKYATNINMSYTIAGLGVNFSLMPYSGLTYVISVSNKHSRDFEKDKRFDKMRQFFINSPISSMYDKKEVTHKTDSKRNNKPLIHYHTDQLPFGSEQFQTIIQNLSQMDAVIIVPREQMPYGDVKDLASESEHDDDTSWAKLDWMNTNEIPMPPIKENLLLRISAPIITKEQKGKPVFKHSERYKLAKETMALEGMPLAVHSTIEALRQCYLKWKNFYIISAGKVSQRLQVQPELEDQREVCRNLRQVIENKTKAMSSCLNDKVKAVLQVILDSEYLDTNGLYFLKFEEEMLFMSPDKSEAQAFLNAMPCSAELDGIRKCIEDYLNNKTDIINSPDKW